MTPESEPLVTGDFAVVELLVAISVLGMRVAMPLTTLSRAREKEDPDPFFKTPFTVTGVRTNSWPRVC